MRLPRPASSVVVVPALVALFLCACAGVTPVASSQNSPEAAADAVDREPDETATVDPVLADNGIAHVVVKESFVTALTPEDNVDSPAVWVDGKGQALLLATGKKSGH